jgi:hypothetical protein
MGALLVLSDAARLIEFLVDVQKSALVTLVTQGGEGGAPAQSAHCQPISVITASKFVKKSASRFR